MIHPPRQPGFAAGNAPEKKFSSRLVVSTLFNAVLPPRRLGPHELAAGVNDGVMGGVSEGTFKITDKKIREFFGALSRECNGGFASVRTKAKT